MTAKFPSCYDTVMDHQNSDTLNKALKLFENHEYAYALNLFEELMLRHPDDPRLNHYLRVCAIKIAQTQQPSGLAQLIKKIILSPLVLYSLFLFLIEDNSKAIRFYRRLLKSFPLQISYYQQLITLAQRNKTTKNILFLLQEILMIDPSHTATLKQLGDIYLKQGQLNESKQIYEKLKKQAPNDSDVQRSLKHLSALEALRKGPFSQD